MKFKKPPNPTHFVIEEHVGGKVKTLSIRGVKEKEILDTIKRFVGDIKQLETRTIRVSRFKYNPKTYRKTKKDIYSKTVHTFESLLTLFNLYSK